MRTLKRDKPLKQLCPITPGFLVAQESKFAIHLDEYKEYKQPKDYVFKFENPIVVWDVERDIVNNFELTKTFLVSCTSILMLDQNFKLLNIWNFEGFANYTALILTHLKLFHFNTEKKKIHQNEKFIFKTLFAFSRNMNTYPVILLNMQLEVI